MSCHNNREASWANDDDGGGGDGSGSGSDDGGDTGKEGDGADHGVVLIMVVMIVVRAIMIKLVMRWCNEFLGPYSAPGSVLRPSYILPSPQLSCKVGPIIIPPSLGQ